MDIEVPIRWYFVPSTNPHLAFENVFNARTWYEGSGQQWPELGEVNGAPREWVNGEAPPGLLSDSCGLDAGVWVDGVPFRLADSVSHTTDGVLLCCLGEVVVGVNSVASSNGSITVNPHTGDVDILLNLSHSNAWATLQTFLAGIDTQQALTVIERLTQAVPAWSVQTNGGTPLVWVDPSGGFVTQARGPGVSPLLLRNSSGTPVAGVTSDGMLQTAGASNAAGVFSLKKCWEVFDTGGVSVGHLPLFDRCEPGGIWVDDFFTGTAGTGIAGNAPDTLDIPGDVWSNNEGAYQYVGGGTCTVNAVGASGWCRAVIPCGSSDGNLSLVVANDSVWNLIIFRWAGIGCHLAAGTAPGGGIYLFEWAGATANPLGNAAFVPTGGPNTVLVQLAGSQITVSCGLSTFTVNCASNLKSEVHGMASASVGQVVTEFKFGT